MLPALLRLLRQNPAVKRSVDAVRQPAVNPCPFPRNRRTLLVLMAGPMIMPRLPSRLPLMRLINSSKVRILASNGYPKF